MIDKARMGGIHPFDEAGQVALPILIIPPPGRCTESPAAGMPVGRGDAGEPLGLAATLYGSSITIFPFARFSSIMTCASRSRWNGKLGPSFSVRAPDSTSDT